MTFSDSIPAKTKDMEILHVAIEPSPAETLMRLDLEGPREMWISRREPPRGKPSVKKTLEPGEKIDKRRN
jgi:hypothetical protein